MRLLFFLIALFLQPLLAWAQWQPNVQQAGDRYRSDQVQARLVAHAPQGLRVDAPVWLGVVLDHAPDWHTYWRNSGDSGIPTEITWELPQGWAAGELSWPTPKKFSLGPLGNYGYDGRVMLTAPITLSEAPATDAVTVRAQVNWLACRTECIPEYAELSLSLPTQSPSTLEAALFDHHQSRLPQDMTLAAEMRVDGDHLLFNTAPLPAPWRDQDLTLYPEVPGLIIPGADFTRSWQADGRLQARLPLNPEREASPASVHWVLAVSPEAHGEDAPAGLRLRAQLQGEWPATEAATVPPALAQALAQAPPPALSSATAGSDSYGWSLALALAGGLLLNLMPCVFPVLAIKVLAFTQNDDTRLHRASGLAYTAGVVLSFLVLAALLLGLRQAGQAVGWGFQLQHPTTVALLALLFMVIALNLMGWLEVKQVLPGRWAGLRLRHPVADAAWSGVLATAVASPCTAPFMGAALGAAIALPTAQALGLFAAVGLGMALPYLAISWFPVLGRWLPGPGAWMQRFKELMAFPMLATVIWLVWVLNQQSGANGAAAMLLLLLTVALVAWLLHHARHATWRWAAWGMMALATWGLWPTATQLQAPTVATSSGAWQAWSPQRQAQALAQQQATFVDFTAAWCVTCQVNKLGALSDPKVEQAFERGQWLRLRADWTRHDPEITRALNALQRNGVPTYAVYHPGQAPQVLSELLTTEQLLDALQAR